MKSCNNCERRFKNKNGCKAFIEKPDNCWAWTDDPEWEEKVKKAVERYKGW